MKILWIPGGLLGCLAGVFQARRGKYPQLKVLPQWTVHVFHALGS